MMVGCGRLVPEPGSDAILARRAMPIGSSIFDRVTACFKLRGYAYVHATRKRVVGLLRASSDHEK
jgi:hypothetical protein